MEYIIVESPNPAELVVKITELSGEGWSLQGGVSVCLVSTAPFVLKYFQALTKTREEKNGINR